MTRDDLFALLDDIYSPGVTPWYESDPALAPRIDGMVQSLRDEVAKIVGTRPAVEGPANLNGYHRISWPMQRGLPEWPRQYWMPEEPEIRNYLFPGFFETWPL